MFIAFAWWICNMKGDIDAFWCGLGIIFTIMRPMRSICCIRWWSSLCARIATPPWYMPCLWGCWGHLLAMQMWSVYNCLSCNLGHVVCVFPELHRCGFYVSGVHGWCHFLFWRYEVVCVNDKHRYGPHAYFASYGCSPLPGLIIELHSGVFLFVSLCSELSCWDVPCFSFTACRVCYRVFDSGDDVSFDLPCVFFGAVFREFLWLFLDASVYIGSPVVLILE